MSDNNTLAPELVEAVDVLAQNLVVSEPFFNLEQAYARLQGDAQARDLMQSFKQAEATLRER